MREWIKHTRSSVLLVVLGEDYAAQIGLFLALGFVLLAIFTGNPVYDAIGSICIGVQEHCRLGSPRKPHGQGFIAATSIRLAGNVTLPMARAIVTR